jgi:two-component system chemotaxis sensor kinase CheA
LDKQSDKFFKVFISEAHELAYKISDSLLALEKNTKDKEAINDLFRYLHTLKGSASLDGFEKITDIAHAMEDVFDAAREDKIILSPDNIDTLFTSLDMIEVLIDDLKNPGECDASPDKLIEELHLISLTGENKELSINKKVIASLKLGLCEKEKIKNATKEGLNSFLIDLTFSEEKTGAINSYVIINALKSLSEILYSAPLHDELINIKFLAKAQVFILTALNKEETEKIISKNTKDYLVIETGADKIPSPDGGFVIDENYKFNLDKGELALLKEASSVSKSLIIELDFSSEDKNRNINSYVIFNNLKRSAKLIKTLPDIDRVKEGLNFTRIVYLYAGDLDEASAAKVLSVNCKTNNITVFDDALIEKRTLLTEDNKTDSDKKAQAFKELKKELKDIKPQESSVSVEVEKFIVDEVIENIGELVVNLNIIGSFLSDIMEEGEEDPESLKQNIKLLFAQMQGTTFLCNTLMDYAVLLKLVPLKTLFKKLPRIVRDIARKSSKKVSLDISGERIRVDQDIMHMLEGPLIHILRNSVDHGIESSEERIACGKSETGKITVKAQQEHQSVRIEISDDGAGIDKNKVLKKAISVGLVTEKEAQSLSDGEINRLIFTPGFSTNEGVNAVSGRGVGADVVLHEVEKIGGKIEITSEEGAGTTFRLIFPVMI